MPSSITVQWPRTSSNCGIFTRACGDASSKNRSIIHVNVHLRCFQSKSMSNFSRSEVQTLSTEASDKEAIGIAILVTVLIVSPIIIILVRNVVATIQVLMDSMIDDDNRRFSFHAFQLYSMNLVEKAKELKLEQKKSDAILFQMLPTSVAIRLKQTGRVSLRRRMCAEPRRAINLFNFNVPSGAGRVLRLGDRLFLGYRRLHRNRVVVFSSRGLLVPQLNLQSVWRPDRVLRCVQGWDVRWCLHGT